MPMNEYGEIVRNTSPTPSRQSNNRNNRNNNNGNPIIRIVTIAIIIMIIYGALGGFEEDEKKPSASNNSFYHNVDIQSTAGNQPSNTNWNYDDRDIITINYYTYKDGHGITSSEYVIKDSASRKLTSQDTNQLTLRGVNYAKNEIYARHGRKFKSAELQDFFDSRDWYYGYLDASKETDKSIEKEFNSYEKYNAKLLRDLESSMGTYQLDR